MPKTDWNPALYAQFAGLRLRPALDLLNRVGVLPDGDVIDLGCGNGAAAPVLAARFPDRRIIGVDSSPAMLDKAKATGLYADLALADIATWMADRRPALIFSNATLHWLDNHAAVLARLARQLAPGGTLAVQVPHQNPAPSNRTWLELAERYAPGAVDPATTPGVLKPAEYHQILAPLGKADIWETEYLQVLAPEPGMHPVRAFSSSTFARPILAALDEDTRRVVCTAYDAAMATAYPPDADGHVLFPFRRLFFTLDIA